VSTVARSAKVDGYRVPFKRLLRFNYGGGNQRDQNLMVADQRDSRSNAHDRPCHHVCLRAVHAQEIDVDGREAFERRALIARKGDRLQKYLGQDHGRTAVEIHAAGQPCHARGEVSKIAQARLTDVRTRRRRMHMNDVGADADMHGDGNAETSSGNAARPPFSVSVAQA